MTIGASRAIAVTTAEIVPPYPDRPTEGFLHLDVDMSPMASASVEVRGLLLLGEMRSLHLIVCVFGAAVPTTPACCGAGSALRTCTS